ncbi:hypothetical protein TCAL_09062 [Tigriopus californicus]|uniref:Kazal-like domain-containing protein n=1 Tax=Tigriopus californicus TaxID=6832 RepID=A0A553P1M3_TIGCA|nr:uncharacterized protein LOC131883688 [Tigriopus californicus]TRY71585.1 hypothetical protein TCAL_09062 [Tigriopus californicus]|eukprot:TCALIF_09062-PA protein Name:"Protein of unknown function" AED:0.28 eAED:0.28 QI:154/1/1/1/1/1/2/63/166
MNSLGWKSLLMVCTLVSVGECATGAVSCGNCRAPKFQDREFYLPFCAEDQEGNQVTHKNVCDAICSGKFTKGSCDGCETECTAVFMPVCSLDQRQLFANSCHAKCSGLGEEEYKDCEGLNIVIPGKTKLPPNNLLPKRLQNSILKNTHELNEDDLDQSATNEDQDV